MNNRITLKRMISFVLVFVMMLSLLPVTFAENTNNIQCQYSNAFESILLTDEDGNKVIDFIHDDIQKNWNLSIKITYTLKVIVKRTSGVNDVSVRLSGLDSHGNMQANGIKIMNPPGGTINSGTITHDFFDQLVSFDKIEDITYGSNNTPYSIQDGKLIYHIKDTTATNTNIGFEISFQIDESAFSNMELLKDAIEIDMLDNPDEQNIIESFKTDLPMNKRNSLISTISFTTIIEGGTATVTTVCTGNTSIFDSIEFDIIYPQNAILDQNNIIFSASASKTDPTRGTILIGDTDLDENTKKKSTHITISHGYKKNGDGLSISYNFTFPKEYFPIGSYPLQVKNGKVKYMNNDIKESIKDSNSSITIISANSDKTSLSGKDENVYNQTIHNKNDYISRFGFFSLINDISINTPYEKIIEGDFNKTNTDVNIKLITIPKGTSDYPEIRITGLDNEGNEKTLTLTKEQLDKATKNPNVSSLYYHTYYLLSGNDFGFKTITHVYADIGSIVAKEKSNANTNRYDVKYNGLGVYGNFTTEDVGIKVVNSFHVYNKDPNTRDNKNGDLYVEKSATSVSENVVGFEQNAFNIYDNKNKLINQKPFVPVKTNFTISGAVISTCSTDITKNAVQNSNGIFDGKNKTANATSMMINNPVVYLLLPSGFSYTKLSFSLQTTKGYPSIYGLKKTEKLSPVNLDYSAENVSYLNHTGDGTSLYKITFPEGTYIGSYQNNGEEQSLLYSVTLTTVESIKTGSYQINDLINITSQDGLTGAVSTQIPGKLCNLRDDKYNINNGNRLLGVTDGNTEKAINLQGLTEVQVENSISVTKVNGTETNDNTWFTYNSEQSSIALLGLKSEGQIRTKITNTGSNPSNNVDVIIPIPTEGEDLGDLFMDSAFPYTMNVTWKDKNLPDHFTAKYIKLNPQDGQGAFSYVDVDDAGQANAILLHSNSMEGKEECIAYFDYTIKNEQSKQITTFRTAHTYVTGGETFNKVGNYIATEIALGSISGVVFDDANKNGIKDENEFGISDSTVVVIDSVGNIQTRTTNKNGQYHFPIVREDNITVRAIVDKTSEYKFSDLDNIEILNDGFMAKSFYESVGINTILDFPMTNVFTLQYNANGATGTLPPDVETSGKDVTISKKPDNLVKDGYEFVEWNTKADGSGASYQPNSIIKLSDENCKNRILTLYAIWQEGTYKITLDYNGGTADLTNPFTKKGTQSYYKAYKDVTNTTLPLNKQSANKPHKTGYDFVGWTIGSSNEFVTTTSGQSSGDVTLHAKWTEKTGYIVKYDSGKDATVIKDKTNVSWTSDELLPNVNPTRIGYDFVGWYYNDSSVTNLMQYSELAKDDTIKSITLTAKWKVKSNYIVNFNPNGGTLSETSKTVSWDSSELYPETEPIKDGYAFLGWSLTQNGEIIKENTTYNELVNNDENITHITIFAIWEKIKSSEVVVRYETNSETVIPDEVIKRTDVIPIPSTNPIKEGFVFNGWKYNDEIIQENIIYDKITEEDSITLVAQWEDKIYTVKYENAGDIPDATTKWKSPITLPIVSKLGYIFDGWFHNSKEVFANDSVSTLAPLDNLVDNILTLVAKWTQKSYAVSYNTNGGNSIKAKTNLIWESKNLLPDETPARNGYQLSGWFYHDVEVSNDISYSDLVVDDNIKEIELIAKWDMKHNYTVKYDTKGGNQIDDKLNVAWTDTNLLPLENPTKTGYTFSGWKYDNITVSNSNSYESLANTDQPSITLVAQWVANDYPIVYMDGENEVDWNQISHPTIYTYGNTVTLINPPEKEFYRFDGWYRTADSDEVVTKLTENENINNNEIVLYGKWTQTSTPITPVEPKTAVYKVEYYQQQLDDSYQLIDTTFPLYDDIGKEVIIQPKTYEHYTYNSVLSTNKGIVKKITNDGTGNPEYLTLKLYYDLEKYTVSYDLNGGNAQDIDYSGQEYYYNSSITTKSAPSKTNYEFVGWLINTDNILNENVPFTITEDITLIAQWKQVATPITPVEPKTAVYKIEHYKQQIDGTYTLADSEFPLYGDINSEVSATNKNYEHYTYNDKLSTAKGTICKIELDDDGNPQYLILKLYYDLDKYTVSYNLNGGSSKDTDYGDKTFYYGESLQTKDAPNKENHKFIGWKIEGTDTIVNENEIFVVSDNINLIAQWKQIATPITPIEPKTAVYRIEHYQQQINGEYTLYESEFPLYGEINTTVTATVKTYKHYSLNNKKSILSGTIIKPETKDNKPIFLELKLYYDLDKYTVSYDLNGGNTSTDYNPEKIYYGDQITVKTSPKKENYKFVGWLIDGTTQIVQENEILPITKNVNLIAQWEQVSTPITPVEPKTTVYKVEYYQQQIDDSYQLVDSLFPLYDDIGKEVIIQPKTYEHYTYNSVLSTNKGIVKKITSNKTGNLEYLTLKLYYDLNKYTLSYDLNGGLEDDTYKEKEIYYGSSILLETTPTKKDYSFIGWKLNDTDTVLKIGDSFILTDTTKLTAQWEKTSVPVTPIEPKVAIYKVEHYQQQLNGNYQLVDTDFPLYEEIGSEVFASTKNYENYHVNDNKSTKSGIVSKVNNDQYLTLKIYYDLNEYSVEYDFNGGISEDKNTSEKVLYGSQTTTKKHPTKDGYQFIGWKIGDTDAILKAEENITITKDMKLIAQWKEIKKDNKKEKHHSDKNNNIKETSEENSSMVEITSDVETKDTPNTGDMNIIRLYFSIGLFVFSLLCLYKKKHCK